MRKKTRGAVGTRTSLEPRSKYKSRSKTFSCSRCGNTERKIPPRFIPAAGIKCDKCGGQMNKAP